MFNVEFTLNSDKTEVGTTFFIIYLCQGLYFVELPFPQFENSSEKEYAKDTEK